MIDTKQNAFYPDISFIKYIAITLIIFCHIGEIFSSIDQTLFYIFTTGQMACQLFFISSSFSLCFSYSKAPTSYRDFLYKRFKRIAPQYWGAIIVTALFCCFGPLFNNYIYSSFFQFPLKIIINFLLLHGFIPYGNNDVVYGGWFVGALIIFYLIFPCLYKFYGFIRKHTNNIIIILLLFVIQTTVAVAFSVLNIDCPPLSFAYFSVLNQLSSFLVGFVVHDLYSNGKINKIKYPSIWFIVSLAVALTAYVGGYFSNWKSTFIFAPLFFSVSYIFLYSSVNNFLNKKDRRKSPAINLMSKIGNRSYGIYLTHLFIIYSLCRPLLNHLFFDKQINSLICFLIICLIAFPLCFAIGIAYDKLFDRFKNITLRKDYQNNKES